MLPAATIQGMMARTVLPVPSPVKFTPVYTNFITNNNFTESKEKFITYALYGAAWSLGMPVHFTEDSHFGVDAITVPVGGAAVGPPAFKPFNYSAAGNALQMDPTDPNYTQEYFNWMDATLTNMIPLAIELFAAEHKKGLKAKNIENLFKSARFDISGDALLPHIRYLGSLFIDMSGDVNFQAALPNNKWLLYRFTATSTPKLCQLMMDDIATDMGYAAPDGAAPGNERQRILNAVAAPWSLALSAFIPEKIIAITYVYLRQSGRLPTDWYQGKRAYSSATPMFVNELSTNIDRLISLRTNVVAVGVANIAAVQTNLRALA